MDLNTVGPALFFQLFQQSREFGQGISSYRRTLGPQFCPAGNVSHCRRTLGYKAIHGAAEIAAQPGIVQGVMGAMGEIGAHVKSPPEIRSTRNSAI